MRIRSCATLTTIQGVGLLTSLALTASLGHAQQPSDIYAPPADDETLIYVMRESRYWGSAVTYWVAVNEQTVGRVGSGNHSVIRAKAGLITLNLAVAGVPFGVFVLDDRPGETIYLEYDTRVPSFLEVSEERGKALLADTVRMDIAAPSANDQYGRVLMNLGLLFDLMRPAERSIDPGPETAVITFLRPKAKDNLSIGVWGGNGFIGSLRSQEAVEVEVPAGEHFFLAGYNGRDLLHATVEGGMRYYALVDVGRAAASVKFVPVEGSKRRNLRNWLKDSSLLSVDPDATQGRVAERLQHAIPYVDDILSRGASGELGTRIMGADHAYEVRPTER